MTKKVLVFTVFLSLFSLVSFGTCWPYQFGQLATDYYKGMSIPSIKAFYFTKGKPMSLVWDCHPKSQYIFAWEDGFYIWGIYGGNGANQCTYVSCPAPLSNPNERMVFVSAAKTNSGTKFLIDSVKWDASGFGFFNFDMTSGIVHEAGNLLAPKVKSSSVILRGIANATIEIPLPKSGFYSDTEINPSSLIAGVAIYGKFADTQPQDLSITEFQLLKTIPVNLDDYSQMLNPRIETDVDYTSLSSGKPYFAYTLILNDGTSAPLEMKPTLPLTSPATCALPSLVTRELDVNSDNLKLKGDKIEATLEVNPINSIRAFKNGKNVELEFSISESENFGDVEILRSCDLINWEKISYLNERSGRDFKIKDTVNLEPELGVFYEIHIKDVENGKEIYSVRTRAREI